MPTLATFASSYRITHISARELDSFECAEPAYRRFDVTQHWDAPHDSYVLPGLIQPATLTLTTSKEWLVDVFLASWREGTKLTLTSLPGGMSVEGFVIAVKMSDPASITFKCTGAPKRPGFLTSALQEVATELACEARKRAPIDTGALRLGVDFGKDESFTAMHPNCRCVVPAIMKEKPVKIRNKFYVAAPSVTTHSEQDQDNVSEKVHLSTSPNDRSGKWTRKDIKDAVTHAEQMLADNAKLEHVAVVKIVKIVRRPKPKFIVEDVK